jgi:hypothetical protein
MSGKKSSSSAPSSKKGKTVAKPTLAKKSPVSAKNKKHVSEDSDTDREDHTGIAENYGAAKKKDNRKSAKSVSSDDDSNSESSSGEDSEDEKGKPSASINNSFKQAVVAYVKLDDKSRELREKVSQINKKKKTFSEYILKTMGKQDMGTIGISDGKLHLNKCSKLAPINQDQVFYVLRKELGQSKAERMMDKIQDQREESTSVNLKRVTEKNKRSYLNSKYSGKDSDSSDDSDTDKHHRKASASSSSSSKKKGTHKSSRK